MALATVFAVSIGFSLLRMPVQVSDSLEEILAVQKQPSAWAAFETALLADRAHVRPLRTTQTKILLDLSAGHYRLAYRGFHAALVLACLLLFVRALRVRTPADLAAASFALTVVMGMEAFRGGLQEAYPINHFLEVSMLCLLTLNLAQARPSARVDLAAALTFVLAVLTLESGLLVWVVAAAAWGSGLRGISWRGVAALTILAAAYVLVRRFYLEVATPGLGERTSGYWLGALDADEQRRRFLSQPFVFYTYNVVAAALSILFSEPQGGTIVSVSSWQQGDVPPRVWLSIASSFVTTALIVRASWRAQRGGDLRLLIVGSAVIGANAVFCYAYIKDEIMIVAGVFYAIAAFVAVRATLGELAALPRAAAVSVIILLAATGSAWAMRSAGVHQVMRAQAFKERNDWGLLPATWKAAGKWPQDPAGQRLLLDLRRDALIVEAPNPQFEPRWAYRWWGE